MTPAEALAHSVADLQRSLDTHCRYVSEACGGVAEVRPLCRRSAKLRIAVAEAIEAIEATRRAFKSRQLEAVRQKLIRALADVALVALIDEARALG